MDGFSGYNQIKMAPEDMEKTTFVTQCYPVQGKIIIVHGEEEYMISHLNSFCYVELDGEFIETPFQHLKR